MRPQPFEVKHAGAEDTINGDAGKKLLHWQRSSDGHTGPHS